jgi:cation diffusion facilitator family transporter
VPLTRYAWVSIATALATMGLKTAAYLLTGSVGLLSDAMESLVNLAGAVMALWMLSIAARPADRDHAYGHNKAEYFSSGVEGTLILIAAASIAWAAVRRLLAPRELEQLGLGLSVSVAASLLNLGVALVLLKVGRRRHSITLEANAHHLMTDVWTSVGVLLGVGAVALTGWLWLDALVAMAVAANIVWTGVQIVRRSVSGLMDTALPAESREAIESILASHTGEGIAFHALRTRLAGPRGFVDLHLLVPGDWTVERGHILAEKIESEIRTSLPSVTATIHLEPIDDPASWADQSLDGV